MEVAVGLGSNKGDRAANLRAGIAFLERLSDDGSIEVSSFYDTAPVDCPPGSQDFINAVVLLNTSKQPEELLRRMQEFERELGRPMQREKNAPRALDMDLLYAGDITRTGPELMLPHPRLVSRRFVLEPLSDLRPDLVLPGQAKTVKQLLAALPPEGVTRRAESND